jgi:hypothetical protein
MHKKRGFRPDVHRLILFLVFTALIAYRAGGLTCRLAGTGAFTAVNFFLIPFQIRINDRSNVFLQTPNPLPESTCHPLLCPPQGGLPYRGTNIYNGAGKGVRTLDTRLGKPVLCH